MRRPERGGRINRHASKHANFDSCIRIIRRRSSEGDGGRSNAAEREEVDILDVVARGCQANELNGLVGIEEAGMTGGEDTDACFFLKFCVVL